MRSSLKIYLGFFSAIFQIINIDSLSNLSLSFENERLLILYIIFISILMDSIAFFAGKNSLKNEDGIWVVSMGHLLSLFDREWLGIQPNFKIVMLRYCEFNLVHDGKILQTAFYFDIPHLMSQANQNP